MWRTYLRENVGMPGLRNRIFLSFLSLIFFFSITNGWAQSDFFSTLSIRDGLPTNVISAIAQDQNNFIWIGTANGLSRYDGYRFKTFTKSESLNSLPANEISTLLMDGEYLWIGTWRGLCKINTITFQITRTNLGKNNVVRTLYKGADNTLWVGTATGLLRYERESNTFQLFTQQNSNLSHNTIRTIYQDRSGNLWVGTYDKLNKLAKGENKFITIDLKGDYKPSLKNNLISGDIRPASATSDSLLWIGTETGLCLLNTFDGTFQRYAEQNTSFSNEVIKCIYQDTDGNLWLGTDFGLNVFNPKTKKNITYFHNPRLAYSISNNVIWQIYEDKGGIIWFVTSNGLSKLNTFRNFYQYHEVSYANENQIIGNQVKSMLITTQGDLWLATQHGVVRMNHLTGKKEIFDTNTPGQKRILLNNVYALEEDDHGRIWIGTAGGINIWDEAKQKMYAVTANATNGLISNYIARFAKGSDGSFWVSAWEGGLFKAEGNFENPDELKFTYAGDFASERNTAGAGSLWALQSNKLFSIDLKTLKQKEVTSFYALSKDRDVNCLYYAPIGKSVWAGTQNGLIEYNPDTNKATLHPVITGNDVKPDNIIEDKEGNIWGAVNNFIFKLHVKEQQVEVFPLDKDIPLKSFSFGCAAKTSSGEIVFGGDNGYISVYPEIKPNQYIPPVFITALEINNDDVNANQEVGGEMLLHRDIAFTDSLVLGYGQRSIAFEFASLHYWQPSMNVYAYKLEGFDPDWNYVSGLKNFAVYSNLSPGTYTLHVKGTNNYGIWNDHEAILTIRVKPPLFLSTGFIIAYIILIIAITILALRFYTARLYLKNELKIALLEKDHAEEIYNTKQQFFTNISHELRTPISLILPPIQQLLKSGNLDEESERLVSLTEKNSHRLLRVVNQILDVRKLENDTLPVKITSFDLIHFGRDLYQMFEDKAQRNGISFIFQSSVNHCTLWADTEKIETIFFNLISNAFKFTPKGGSINFTVDKREPSSEFLQGSVMIKVSDTGIGIPSEEQGKIFDRFYQTTEAKNMELGSGIGLTLASEYVKLHHGKIEVESKKGNGTSFIIQLPLGNAHFPVDFIHDQQEINLLATKTTFTNTDKSYHFGLESDKPLVLIIDDNPDMIDFIQVSLHKKYNFIAADQGEEGLRKANNFLPEIIVSDVMMPVMDGLSLCQAIKENPKTAHISVILLTAKTLTSQKVEGIRVGADSYITKPFEIELLEAQIDQLLKRKKELADYFKHELIVQPQEGSNGENVDDKFIKKVISIIEANISNSDLSVEMLSQEIGLSTTHLYRKIKSLTNLSPNDVIRKYRLKKASLLLSNKEGNISEVMYEVGFSNLSYFSKCFRAEFGLSPKEYQGKMSKGEVDIRL